MSRIQRLEYYHHAARFWLKASELQRTRCLEPLPGSDTSRTDMNFYVVSVQRLREVARMSAQRGNISAAAVALDAFDAAWPAFKSFRNHEEHILGPANDKPPFGIWYFSDVVASLGPGGFVEFVVRVKETQESVRVLASTLEAALTAELALLSGGE